MSKLVLVRATKDLGPLTPAVLWEVAAAKYVKIDICDFRDLVRKGVIKARVHYGRKRWMYLKEDLDDYLRNCPVVYASRGKIHSGEVPSKPPAITEVSNV